MGATLKTLHNVMKLTGIKAAASELKNAQYGRIYVNKATGHVFAMSYIDQNSYSNFESEDIEYVCRYNCRYDNLSMKWLKEQVEERLYELGIC